MKIIPLALAAFLAAPALSQSTPTVLVGVDHRPAQSLNGPWHYILDPYSAGLSDFQGGINKHGFFENREPEAGSNTTANNGLIEYSFARSPVVRVPGDWNTQNIALLNYEGLFWYQRDFEFTPKQGERTFIHIGAANYRARVFVNGQHICDHEGGFTPFDCDATAALKSGKNFAVIAVDDTRLADGIPTLKTDWYNYGGLTRDVSLVSVPAAFIDDYDLRLSRTDHKTIEGYVHVRTSEGEAPAGTKVHVAIPGAHVDLNATTYANGRAAISITPASLDLWAPGNPKLYKVELSSGSDKLTDEIGFRTIEVQGTHILLNGKPIALNGINVHAEAPIRGGRVNTDADVKTLFDWLQQLNCNFVRLAHYPHDERMTREADRRGIMVWSEVPVYWAVHFDDPALLVKAKQQLGENIRRDRNKASVILWSIANETPNTPARTAFLTKLADHTHELDPTRLVTAALLVRGEGDTKIVDDPLGKSLDVLGTNEYAGWYEMSPEKIPNVKWDIRYDKPVIMSEFGGGAVAGLHGPETQRWTEEFQAAIYRNQITMLSKIPQLRGTTPWLLMDFRSPVRLLPGVQDGFNRKGLISDHGQKKQAFSILQKAYKENALAKPE